MILDVQKMLVAAIKGDSHLGSVLKGVYDAPPEQPQFPFATVGDISSTAWDTKTSEGLVHTVNINTWGRTSRVEIKQCQDALYQLLHRHQFELADGSRASVYLMFSNTVVDPDKQTYRGMSRYRIEN